MKNITTKLTALALAVLLGGALLVGCGTGGSNKTSAGGTSQSGTSETSGTNSSVSSSSAPGTSEQYSVAEETETSILVNSPANSAVSASASSASASKPTTSKVISTATSKPTSSKVTSTTTSKPTTSKVTSTTTKKGCVARGIDIWEVQKQANAYAATLPGIKVNPKMKDEAHGGYYMDDGAWTYAGWSSKVSSYSFTSQKQAVAFAKDDVKGNYDEFFVDIGVDSGELYVLVERDTTEKADEYWVYILYNRA